MIIKLHRWQPRAARYRTVQHDLEEMRPILDMIANNNGVRVTPDPAVETMVLRTQRVDRITVDITTDTVEVFLSPIVDRKYTVTTRDLTGKSRKASMSDKVCTCRHTVEQHSSQGQGAICLVPGCSCNDFQFKGKRRDLVAAVLPKSKPTGGLDDIFNTEE